MPEPTHVYLDLDVVNNDFNASAPQLRFEETRNTPFLDGDAAEYFCSVVRFSIQTGDALPVIIPSIETGQPDRNKTAYQITLKEWRNELESSPSLITTVSVMFEPEDLVAPVAMPPLEKQDLSGSYYYIYNYFHFIKMINMALETAVRDLVRQWRVENGVSTGYFFDNVVGVYFDFDTTTNRAILNLDADFANSSPMEVYFNDRLYRLFTGLPAHYVSSTGNMNYKIRMDYTIANQTVIKLDHTRVVNGTSNLTKTTKTMLQIPQEICSIAMWSPVASIVFATSLLPIVPTQTSATKTLGTNNLVSRGNNSNLFSIISDFSVAVDMNNQYRPNILYNPGAEYRLLDMNSLMNLTRVDLMVFWKDVFGNMHPFELLPGCSAHVKLLFRKKEFNNIS